MSKKKTEPKEKNNPYLVDKLSKIPAIVKVLFLKFWVAGAAFYLIFMSIELLKIDFLDQLAIFVLILTLLNEYVIHKLIVYISVPGNSTIKYLPHFIKRSSVKSLVATLIYTTLLTGLSFAMILYLWMGVLNFHTIDYYLSGAESGPFGFGLCYIAVDMLYISIRNPILNRYLHSKSYIEKKKTKDYIGSSIMNALDKIKEYKIVAVVRADSEEKSIKLAKCLYDGGIRVLEITYTIPNASQTIRELIEFYKSYEDKPIIGAGTVYTKKDAISAIQNGAAFIVSPGFSKDVSKIAAKNKVSYIPGVITPSEIIVALKNGASMVKLFPGSLVGPSYVKSLKGPFPNLQLLPTGGVSIDNLKEWFDAGVVGVGVGGELTKPALSGNYQGVMNLTREFLKEIEKL